MDNDNKIQNTYEENIQIGKTINNDVVIERIGKGSFGEVYKIKNNKSKKEYALKVPLKTSVRDCQQSLLLEHFIYSKLNINPDHQKFGISSAELVKSDRYCMKMTLQGESLEKLLSKYKKFGMRTVLIIAIQIIRSIQYIHDNEFIHRDIKADNFVLNVDNPKKIFCIDFGMAKRYFKNGQHIKQSDTHKFCGTARYASIAAHKCIQQSRKDDLESIGYLLVYFFKGRLPWQNIKHKNKSTRYKLIGDAKENTTSDILCKGMPEEFKKYIDYCKNLKFQERPNYVGLIKMFIQLYNQLGFKPDDLLEWEKNSGDIINF